jgi:transcriptional regulator with XRE-family HTH domain
MRTANTKLPENSLTPRISSVIRRRRETLGLTQHQFAERLGVTYQQVHKYETGVNRINVDRLYQAAHILGLSLLELLGEAGAEVPEHRGQSRVRLNLALEINKLSEIQQLELARFLRTMIPPM